MNDTQTQIERLIELAIVQRTELKQLVEQLPQLREHLNAEVERTIEEVEPQLRAELEDWTTKQTIDQTAKLGAALEAKITELSKALEVSTQARYNAIIAERAKSANLAEQAEAKIAEHAAKLPSAVKEIVSAELSRFPRAGEIDQLRKEFAEPRGLNPRGKWSPDETYNRLDLVAYNGDSYVSNRDGNAERPSRTSAEWTLSAARGAGGGGGGITSLNDVLNAPTSGQIIGSENGQYVPKTLAAGANITITETANTITIIGDEGQISLSDGTAGAPSLHFTSDTDTGVYRPGANTLGISVSGTQIAYFDEDGLTIPNAGVAAGGSFHAANGNANNPSHSFTSDQNTGFFRHATNQIGVSTNGVASLIFTQNAGELLGHTGVSVTFGAGSSGATIALGQGTNGGVTITPKGSGTAVVNGTTIPASKTLVVTTDKLSALAATSSSELAGVISDETGTGSLVFANTPTLVTPNIGAATGTSVNLSSNATVGGTLTVNGTGTSTIYGDLVVPGQNKAINAQGYFLFKGAYCNIFSRGTSGGWSAGIVFHSSNTNPSASIVHDPTSGDLTLYTNATASNYASTDRALLINTSKQVQVLASTASTSTSSGALVVSGGVGVAGAIFAGGNLTVSGTGTSSFAGRLFGIATNSPEDFGAAYSTLQLNAVSTGGGAYSVYKNVADSINFRVGADGQGVINVVSNHPLLLSTNNTERLRVTASGNVLIGTTTDSGNGKLQLTSHTTSASGIGFGTETALYRAAAGSLVVDHIGGSAPTLNLSANGSIQSRLFFNGTNTFLESYTSHSLILRTNQTTALTLDSSQNATFAGPVTISKAQAAAYTSLTIQNGNASGYSQLNMISGPNTASINYAPGVFFKISIPSADSFQVSTNNTTALTIDSSQNATFAGSIKTVAPSGGTAKPWELGEAATVSPTSPNRTIRVEIDGAVYYIHAKTTND
jgi:hypothetical protein